jgi:hypothetical protein
VSPPPPVAQAKILIATRVPFTPPSSSSLQPACVPDKDQGLGSSGFSPIVLRVHRWPWICVAVLSAEGRAGRALVTTDLWRTPGRRPRQEVGGVSLLGVVPAMAMRYCIRAGARVAEAVGLTSRAVDLTPWAAQLDMVVVGESMAPFPPGLLQ